MKKILVTGSNGYIGNALVLALLNRKKEFTVRAAARRGSILNSNDNVPVFLQQSSFACGTAL